MEEIVLIEDIDNYRILINKSGDIIGVGTGVGELLAVPTADILGDSFFSFFSESEQIKVEEILKKVIVDNHNEKLEKVTININQQKKKVDLKFNLIKEEEGEIIEVCLIKSKERQKVKTKTEILAALPDKSPNPVIQLDHDGTILYANQASRELMQELGVSKNDKVPKEYQEIVDEVLATNGSREITVQLGEEIYLFSFAAYTKHECVYLYGQDITGLKQANKHIEQLVNYDLLSGLPNRNLFIDRLERLIIKAKEADELIAVLFADIDDFKKINDTFGHQAGDKLLTDTANKLEECITESDTLARLSGDQFGILINGMNDITRLNQILEDIMDEFKEPFTVYPDPFCDQGKEVFVSVSMGVSLYPQDSTEVEQLIKNAEVAMHKVKQAGKNNYRFFSQEMNESFLQELELEAKLRRALDRKEFILYYQPQIDIQENTVDGVEALIRWDNDELGLVSPGQFIPLAERTGLILEIGNWVLQRACCETKFMQEKTGMDLEIAVNLSPRQFKDKELIDKVDNALDQSGLAPHYLTLEITESIIMEDIDQSIETLMQLKERGINISVDDFGTGYSSLNYLSTYPLDELKIDRSFIMDIPADEEKVSISKAVINLAHALNLTVTAEGVEEYEQIKFLKENECERLQGYYYSKPVPRDSMLHFLEYKNNFEEGKYDGTGYLAGINSR
ncbi:EAL domain-containing protein [Halanaerobacter jeridensis]|uniref:Diguanylate cyclase (GGDEF)-like protein n=1 Tax=Halanaerobacter jeridensis TaxID=706427 RepID=A0A938XTU2_9FIRM|nr:EAL domain-containing protein [Halanaerobacter jeridensis]MBM7557418.1 diguanylate cyclase (GGDEF)-like protein [Halanaerobacter jeridensis]